MYRKSRQIKNHKKSGRRRPGGENRVHRTGESELLFPEMFGDEGLTHDQIIKSIDFVEDRLPKNCVYSCTINDIKKKLREMPAQFLTRIRRIRLCNQVKMNPGVDAACYDDGIINIYAVPADLVIALFKRKPKPSWEQERLQYGAYWKKKDGCWMMKWRKEDLRRYTLNHILFHEIGHTLFTGYGPGQEEKMVESFADKIAKTCRSPQKSTEQLHFSTRIPQMK